MKARKVYQNNYLIKQLPTAMAYLNKKFEIIHASDQWAIVFECDSIDIYGERLFSLTKVVPDNLKDVLRTSLKGKISKLNTEWRFQNSELTKWLEWSSAPWYDDNENIIGIIVQVEDITKRISDNLKLEKLATLVLEKSEIAKIGSWEYNVLTGKTTWCDMTRKIHEVSNDYVPDLEEAIKFYKEGNDRNTISMAIHEASYKGRPWNEKLQMVTEKGNEKWVTSTGKPIFNNDKIVGLVGTFYDVSNQIEANLKSMKKRAAASNLNR